MTKAAAKLPYRAPPEPQIPGEVDYYLRKAMDPHPNVGVADIELPEAMRSAAQRTLLLYLHYTKPAADDVITDWLRGVNSTASQPLPKEVFIVRAAAICKVLTEVPWGLFNGITQTQACKTFTWFPSAAEVYELLMVDAKRLHSVRNGLTRLLAVPAPEVSAQTEAQRTARRAEQAQRVSELLAELKSRVAANRGPATNPKPVYLSRAELAAAYETAATHPNSLVASAAAARLSALGVQPPEA